MDDQIINGVDLLCPMCKCDCDILVRCEDGQDRCIPCAVEYLNVLADKSTTPFYWCHDCGVRIYTVQKPRHCPDCGGTMGFTLALTKSMEWPPKLNGVDVPEEF